MLEPYLLAAVTLIIALYIQARLTARQIRRNRTNCTAEAARDIELGQTRS